MTGRTTSNPEYLTVGFPPSLCLTRALFGLIRFKHFQLSIGNKERNTIHIE